MRSSLIPRSGICRDVRRELRDHPVVSLLGARQVGKTTVARLIADDWNGPVTYLDLENPQDQARLSDPMGYLQARRGLVILDEIQQFPEVFGVLRVLADRRPRKARFLILGSSSPDLVKRGSETLAGRIATVCMSGLTLQEAGEKNWKRLWLRGGLPPSYKASSNPRSFQWRRDYIQTFLERDIPQMGIRIPSRALLRFWTMISHYHGQIWNSSKIGSSLGVRDNTVRKYLDLLEGAYVVRVLRPWHENISKRQVKAPKAFIADSGVLHALLGQETMADLECHPMVGASWEGFAMEAVIDRLRVRPEECFFWNTYAGAELDLMVVKGRRRMGFEFKLSTSPKVTPSMRIALADLGLRKLYVVYPGKESYPLASGIRALPLGLIKSELKSWR